MDKKIVHLSSPDLVNIAVASQRDADLVLNAMRALIDGQGVCTVSDLYNLVGITSHFADEHWGWKDLREANPIHSVSGDYILDLPKPEYIDRFSEKYL